MNLHRRLRLPWSASKKSVPKGIAQPTPPCPAKAAGHGAPQFGMSSCLSGLAARGFKPECVLDIGAALGEWTRMALGFWPEARYFLFEPLEERKPALDRLREEVPSVGYILAGASDAPARLSIGLSANLYESSFAYPGPQNRLVDVVTLDALFRDGRFPQPQFMKLDVQGYEFKVLQGAAETMRACDLILLEMQFFRFAPEMLLLHEGIAWMTARGFVPYEFVDFLRRPLDGAMGQCDLLFARAGHPLVGSNAW
jgi:FkbM family methyltransferase